MSVAVKPKLLKSLPSPPASNEWARYAAAGALVAGAVFLARGQKKAGLVAAAAGTALAAVDQQEGVREGVREFWRKAPKYLAVTQAVLLRVQEYANRVRERR